MTILSTDIIILLTKANFETLISFSTPTAVRDDNNSEKHYNYRQQ